MKLVKFKLENFRSYKDEVVINFDNLTVFVGKNDVGKSTILEALDIFFNDGKGNIKAEEKDINVQAKKEGENAFILTACFSELPDQIVIDDSVETSLKEEYMLNSDEMLEIVKEFKGGTKPSIYIRALHPTNSECSDLLQKKNKDLKNIIKEHNIDCENQSINSIMRRKIWEHFSDSLDLKELCIDMAKGDDAKNIWSKLSIYLPLYSLFQADRKNSDGDSEVQDPLKEAVKEILNDYEILKELQDVAVRVEEKLKDVSNRTLNKLKEMSPEIANSLNPIIPSTENLKWTEVFKNVSITGDEDIPINKRGSGVKRLILLNFFRAEAEKRVSENSNNGIIYAIEEPETSQHSQNQKILIDAFRKLSESNNTQVILTTHSSTVVKRLDFNNLRLIYNGNNEKHVESVQKSALSYPSLNEVNYIAFDDVTEEYHNELYGYIKEQGWFSDFKLHKPQFSYIKMEGGKQKTENHIKTEIIRHQIHHPENTNNPRFTDDDLKQSIEEMRSYIIIKSNGSNK